ncbi:hypothetical protein B0J12DRAFT_266952 [Macrophomina phaseolina]|uniref:Uncharacterized protein n=1 Tax=Macrophomina phaseolina TaxID=35725 RepID=A0ABQ8G1P0_9PEZI|nr:hypothetical protein B0J12DRAFT_266952 [Macrophomina phaseolina]
MAGNCWWWRYVLTTAGPMEGRHCICIPAIILFLKRCCLQAHVVAAPCGDQGNWLMRCQSEPQAGSLTLQQRGSCCAKRRKYAKLSLEWAGRRLISRVWTGPPSTRRPVAEDWRKEGWNGDEARWSASAMGKDGRRGIWGRRSWQAGCPESILRSPEAGESGRRAGGKWSKSEIDDRTSRGQGAAPSS